MKPKLAPRTTFLDDMHIDAPPSEIFPLLCPVREYEWLDRWRCEIVHTASGIAEDGCIFTTASAGDGPMVWVVSRYEPPHTIQFTSVVAGSYVMRLRIDLTPSGTRGSELRWAREFTAIADAGTEWVAASDLDAHRARMAGLRDRLAHYVATGAMLREPPAEAAGSAS
jgi:hypothetical protein